MTSILRALALFSLLLLLPQGAAAEGRQMMLVVDGSGSMWAKSKGLEKLRIAQRGVAAGLKGAPEDWEIGLMAFGHTDQESCNAVEVLAEPKANNARAINGALKEMKFQGKAPIADALRAAAEALNFRDQPATVVLLADGLDNCGGKICEVASELEAEGADFTAHVIGIGMKTVDATRIACIAKRTGGRAVNAARPIGVQRNLKRILAADPAAEPEAEPEAEAEGEGEAEAEAEAVQAPVLNVQSSTGYSRGAPVMVGVRLDQVGTTGTPAQSPAAPALPDQATAMDCQLACESDLLCAAWSYEGAGAAGPASCRLFDFGAALDYTETAPELDAASGMKMMAVQLVRPYVPKARPVQTATATPEPAPEPAAAGGPIEIELSVEGLPEGMAGMNWSVTPLTDGASDQVLASVDGPWLVALKPGEYAVQGSIDGFFVNDTITVAPGESTGFRLFAVPIDGGAAPEEGTEEGMESAEGETTEGETTEGGAASSGDPAEVFADITYTQAEGEIPVVDFVAPEDVMALVGNASVMPGGYACAGEELCGQQHGETGLVFALPPGWATDMPIFGLSGGQVIMVFMGPMQNNGEVPTLMLNPDGWSAENGPCVGTAAGALCAWGELAPEAEGARDIIAASLSMAGMMEDKWPPAGDEGGAGAGTETGAETGTETGSEGAPEGATTLTEGSESGTEGTAEGALPEGPAMEDGTWLANVTDPDLGGCPVAGLEAGLSPAISALQGERAVAWGGALDLTKLGLDVAMPGMGWPGISLWHPQDDGSYRGETAGAEIAGQPPFVKGIVVLSLKPVSATKLEGELVLTAYSEGSGLAGMVNAGLMQCRITSAVTLEKTGG